ncbi:hypothetical protein BCR33DRAFT_785100 [Rhizoclosmatium globosum]|uniref:Uncharacterized protein n=1 Tax=Rhizoclosmatium globosum TaxID=329046 RepID=A0A1Y2CDP0_9FUNG|nr:hypothetical protein BCR33DRAFT_785100 [Rhizoclosmatium globosum]|eukprot:ORY44425.1 hypothetical protein BCR33DRAFT_785100 [Rhizoclosmatium globosum]
MGMAIPTTDKEVYDIVVTGFDIYNQEHIMKVVPKDINNTTIDDIKHYFNAIFDKYKSSAIQSSCGFLQAGKECPPCPGDAEGVKGPCFGHFYPCTPLKITKYQEKLIGMKSRKESTTNKPSTIYHYFPSHTNSPSETDSDMDDSELPT